jgi:hypothetical protein
MGSGGDNSCDDSDCDGVAVVMVVMAAAKSISGSESCYVV